MCVIRCPLLQRDGDHIKGNKNIQRYSKVVHILKFATTKIAIESLWWQLLWTISVVTR